MKLACSVRSELSLFLHDQRIELLETFGLTLALLAHDKAAKSLAARMHA